MKNLQHRAAGVIINKNTNGFAVDGVDRRTFSQQEIEIFDIETKALVNMIEIFLVILFGAIDRKFHYRLLIVFSLYSRLAVI